MESLPPDLAPLVDPAQPLPPTVSFFPQEAGEVGTAWALAAMLGVPSMVGLTALADQTLRSLAAGHPPPLSAAGLSLVALFCGGLLWGTLWNMRLQLRLREERKSPQYRYGLFLTPEALLLRPRQGTPQVLRRAAVVRVFKEQVGGSKHYTVTVRVQYRDSAGQDGWLDIHNVFVARLDEIWRAVAAWAEGPRPVGP